MVTNCLTSHQFHQFSLFASELQGSTDLQHKVISHLSVKGTNQISPKDNDRSN